MSDLYIDLMTDFGFKRIFGREAAKRFLIHFLNTIIKPHTPITSIIYSNTEQVGDAKESRKVVFDIHCQTADGDKYIIEMQNDHQKNFIARSVYYASMAMAGQGERGAGWEYATRPVNTVCLLNFVLLKHYDSSIQRTITLTDAVTCKEFTDKLNFYYVEFPKFDKGIDELETDLDRWLYIFKNLSRLKTRPAALQVGIFKEVLAMAEIAKMSADEQWAYQMSLKHKRDYNNVMRTARESGLEEGIKQGIEQGVHQRNREMAQTMLSANEPIEKIIAYSGLTEAQILQLKR